MKLNLMGNPALRHRVARALANNGISFHPSAGLSNHNAQAVLEEVLDSVATHIADLVLEHVKGVMVDADPPSAWPSSVMDAWDEHDWLPKADRLQEELEDLKDEDPAHQAKALHRWLAERAKEARGDFALALDDVHMDLQNDVSNALNKAVEDLAKEGVDL